MKDLNLALELVTRAFCGVKDKGGKPYLEHCQMVEYKATEMALFLLDDFKSIGEISIAALLHDVIEDTCIGFGTIKLLFGSEIARLVDLVTRKDGESYMQFIDRVKTCPKATIIKKADIMHNMDLTRLEVVTDVDLARVKKYEKALKRLG